VATSRGLKNKRPPLAVFYSIYFVNTTGFVILPHIPQGRERVRGEPLPGSSLAFNHPPAGDHFCTAKVPHQQKRDIQKDVSFLLVRVVIQNFLKKPVISTVFKADE